MRPPHPRKKQTVVVVNLRHRSHRRAGISVSCFLLNGNGGRKSLNQVNIGLVHAAQKLPRVGRKAFHVPALTFGKKSVKSQRRLSASAQTRDDYEFMAWQIHIDIFKVMFARSTDRNLVARNRIDSTHKKKYSENKGKNL